MILDHLLVGEVRLADRGDGVALFGWAAILRQRQHQPSVGVARLVGVFVHDADAIIIAGRRGQSGEPDHPGVRHEHLRNKQFLSRVARIHALEEILGETPGSGVQAGIGRGGGAKEAVIQNRGGDEVDDDQPRRLGIGLGIRGHREGRARYRLVALASRW